MTKSILLRRIFAAFLALLSAALITCAAGLNTQAALAGQLLRLHVIANSDSADDQALKLHVRDRVLAAVDALTADCADVSEAREIVEAALPALSSAARDEIAARGYDYAVSLSLGDAYFPTKSYGAFSLPAGHYDALRVVIGAGAGQNWWCVLFPPFCTAASVETVAAQSGMSEDELEFIKAGDYEIRFRLAEWFAKVMERWTDR
jgi:stage II sporulation protein R